MDILWRKMKHNILEEYHNVTQIIFRTCAIVVMCGIAMAVPYLEVFMDLVGAILLSTLGLFLFYFFVNY